MAINVKEIEVDKGTYERNERQDVEGHFKEVCVDLDFFLF